MEFVGLAAAVAFIATGAKASAVSNQIPHQLHQEMSACLSNKGEALKQACEAGGAAAGKSFYLARSQTAPVDTSDDQDNSQGGGQGNNSGNNQGNNSGNNQGDNQGDSQGGDNNDVFHFEYLPSDHNVMTIDTTVVDPVLYIPPRILHVVFGPGGAGTACVSHGGAIMLNLQAGRLACWTRTRGAPLQTRFGVPPFDQRAQSVLVSCGMRLNSIMLHNGAFTCFRTPVAVQRASVRWRGGVPGRHPPFRPGTTYGRPGRPLPTCASAKSSSSYGRVQPADRNAPCAPNPRDKQPRPR